VTDELSGSFMKTSLIHVKERTNTNPQKRNRRIKGDEHNENITGFFNLLWIP